jgi:hypothetical protein
MNNSGGLLEDDALAVLAMGNQANDIHVVGAFEIPEAEREAIEQPCAQALDLQYLAHSRGTKPRFKRNALLGVTHACYQLPGARGTRFAPVVGHLKLHVCLCRGPYADGFHAPLP